MITVIEVKKNTNENNMSLIRRFTRKVQESGIIQKVKSKRYNERTESKVKTKIATLKRINRKKALEKLQKLGKAPMETKRGRR
ncbi:MAG: 30S ribosomal protein S21 [Candidatus Nomurabacteria bacterium]|jgi:ribosomal protein S21|nr:30S ribosomal protein S21 [Candidatus Nomurabacteria bacterium]